MVNVNLKYATGDWPFWKSYYCAIFSLYAIVEQLIYLDQRFDKFIKFILVNLRLKCLK